MNQHQVKDALAEAFRQGGHRVVFWQDAARGFEAEVEGLAPEGVELIRLPGPSMLAVKIRVEREEPEQAFLIYDTREAPPMAEDWLLDMRQYAGHFSADRASVALGELGLPDRLSLKPYLAQREAFLSNKERLQRLRRFITPEDTELELDRKMIAVLLRCDSADLDEILQRVLAGLVDPESGGLNRTPEGWAEIGKMRLEASFWRMVADRFGYDEAQPNLKALLYRLLVSDLAVDAGIALPGLEHLSLPEPGRRNARVLVARWRDSHRASAAYDSVSAEVEQALDLSTVLKSLPLAVLLALNTFPCTEEAAFKAIVSEIEQGAQQPELETWLAQIQAREGTHWVAPSAEPGSERADLKRGYTALRAAAECLHLWEQARQEAWPTTLEGCWQRYVGQLWRIDQAYRHFNEAADSLGGRRDTLKGLREQIERVYTHGYLSDVARGWGAAIPHRLNDWRVEGVTRQHRFFEEVVRPRLEESQRTKTMVIISDAFRYEAARELVEQLNSRYRIDAELDTMLGVLPSYTALGMAALLPHDTLDYAPDASKLIVDGRPVAGTEQRDAHLKKYQGMAIQADELMAMTQAQGRQTLEGARVVYVYHNQVDAIGDASATEEQVFAATAKAIDALCELANKAVNSFNFSSVHVTADHGYLFSHTAPDESSASRLGKHDLDARLAKKRYVLGETLPQIDEAWQGHTRHTADTKAGMAFLIPKGTNLFHFTGGARYIHGGAMPQEIVVPLIRIRALRGTKAEATRVSAVKLQILGGPHRVTTGRHRFQILQLDPVTERVSGVKVKVDIREGDEPVSDTLRLIFNSQSDSFDDRTQNVWLTLKDAAFDRAKRCVLTVREEETGRELTRAEVIIDRAFTEDF